MQFTCQPVHKIRKPDFEWLPVGDDDCGHPSNRTKNSQNGLGMWLHPIPKSSKPAFDRVPALIDQPGG